MNSAYTFSVRWPLLALTFSVGGGLPGVTWHDSPAGREWHSEGLGVCAAVWQGGAGSAEDRRKLCRLDRGPL